MSGLVTTRSRSTSQSQTVSPEPVDGQRLPLHVAEQALVQRAAGEGVLHDREADQRMIRIRPPPSAGCTMSLSSMPVIAIHEPVSQTSTITQLGISMIARS